MVNICCNQIHQRSEAHFWPVKEPCLIGDLGARVNQATNNEGSEDNIEPLTHVVQPAGKPNVDPQTAIRPGKNNTQMNFLKTVIFLCVATQETL